MIILKKGNKILKYEGIWRNNFVIKKSDYDYKGKLIPWPKSSKSIWKRNIFIKKLVEIENILIKKGNFVQLHGKKVRNCIFGDIYEVDTKLFYIGNNYWTDGLLHYIKKHKIKPSNEFISMIMTTNIHGTKKTNRQILNIPAVSLIKYDKKYLKISRNQLLIMDALMKHGSYTKKYIDNNDKDKFRYSEHTGLLDFNENKLDKIVISGKTNRVDEHDDDIFLPENMIEAYDYEYFFHTHPATPKPGGRADVGILYEFPSTSDIFHFIEHYNNGTTQGSIVITPEGLYIIRKYIVDDKKILLKKSNNMYKNIDKYTQNIQKKAINKYGTDFSIYKFYSEIAQDIQYINLLNKKLNEYDIHIEYKPREKDKKGRWIIDTIYLPVYAIEPKIKK
jgi:hypothetical protein